MVEIDTEKRREASLSRDNRVPAKLVFPPDLVSSDTASSFIRRARRSFFCPQPRAVLHLTSLAARFFLPRRLTQIADLKPMVAL